MKKIIAFALLVAYAAALPIIEPSFDEIGKLFAATDLNHDGVLDHGEMPGLVYELIKHNDVVQFYLSLQPEASAAMIEQLTNDLSSSGPASLEGLRRMLRAEIGDPTASADLQTDASQRFGLLSRRRRQTAPVVPKPRADEPVQAAPGEKPLAVGTTADADVDRVARFVNDGWTHSSDFEGVQTYTKEGAVKQVYDVFHYQLTADKAMKFLASYHRAACFKDIDDTIESLSVDAQGTAAIVYKKKSWFDQRDLVAHFAQLSKPFKDREGLEYRGWRIRSSDAEGGNVHIKVNEGAIVVAEVMDPLDQTRIMGVRIVFASSVDLKLNWFTRALAGSIASTEAQDVFLVGQSMTNSLDMSTGAPCYKP